MRFFNLFTSTRTEIVRKKSIDVALCGRSMVEMLGVLAIVGVLSVGAIAGYSKAIEKYKINKIVQNHSLFITQLAEYKNVKNISGDLSTYVEKLNLFPGYYSTQNSWFVSDGVSFRPLIREATSRFIIDYLLSDDSKQSFNVKLCISLISELAVPLHTSIYGILLWQDNGQNAYNEWFYGDSQCSANTKCLKDATYGEISTLCNTCKTDSKCILAFELF